MILFSKLILSVFNRVLLLLFYKKCVNNYIYTMHYKWAEGDIFGAATIIAYTFQNFKYVSIVAEISMCFSIAIHKPK